MDLYLVFKIGILIFGLISWFLYKSDRSINKNVLNDHIRQREQIRDLTVEELELLQPFLTSKLAVYPYNFQSSLIDNKVSYLLGTCTRKSLYSNTEEIAYYYDVDNIEIFFPYNMDMYIDESNIFEVVFTKHYGIVIKVNDYDIKTAFENYDPNEEYLFRDVKQTKSKEKIFDNEFFEEHNTTHRQDGINSSDVESLSIYNDSKNLDNNQAYLEASKNYYKLLYQREETQFEAAIRRKHSLGWLTSLCLILATVLLIRSWLGENDQISILILICLGAAAFFAWYKPKDYLNPQQVSVVKAKIYDKDPNTCSIEVGNLMVLQYPKYWLNFIPETSDLATEMVISNDNKKLLRYGQTLSINNEVEQFGPPKLVSRNKILFVIGVILSAILYYFTDPVNNGYFAYQYYSQQSENLQIKDFTTLKNSDIKPGDIVNINIKNTSCDVNDLNEEYQCHNFYINSQPMVMKENNVMAIEGSLKHIFDTKFVDDVVDTEMLRFQNVQSLYVDMLNRSSNDGRYVKNSFSKIADIGQMVIDIDKVCKILPVKECDNVKYSLTHLFDASRSKANIIWDDLLTESTKNPRFSEIVETRRMRSLKQALEPFKSELQSELVNVISKYQSDNGVKITLTNQSYVDMAPLVMSKSMRFDENGYINYYFAILNNNIPANINIVGSVSDILYHKVENSDRHNLETQSISGLKVNANHHYNLDENQQLSSNLLIIINVIMFVMMTLIATINAVKLVQKTRINRNRSKEIIKYYQDRLI